MKTLSLDKTAMANPSEFKSALQCKCPKCRTGNMFVGKGYHLGGQTMRENCPHCGFHFEIEPGYFYVAMFVSYAMNVAEMVTLAVATYILTGNLESPWLYITILLGVAFALWPFNFRYSRVILLYWLTPNLHFDPTRAGEA
ncbi:DUF983 domain-containing protein [uncultured Mucilaginibacter sp.]|uniref:DUF983 domain-containing protein n=1 Tax=uncultured Mucilaginibacter sp. TaxID=797541 RepID=UPI0025F6110A|nr:DUF983 domain-containing protein [uncultured Mucilaginibacter sp.]